MTFCKKKLALLTICAFLISCSQSVDDKKADPLAGADGINAMSSTLIVKSIKIDGKQEVGESPTSRQPTDKFYTMKACLDTTFDRDLSFFNFSLTGKEIGTKTLRSDKDACIFWEEHVEIDFTQANQLVEFKRTISVNGTEISAPLYYGIDPINGDNFIDLTKAENRTTTNRNNKLAINNTIVMDQIRFTPKGYGKEDPRNDNNVIDKPFVANTCFNLKSNGQRMARQMIDAYMINEETGRVLKKENFMLNENGCAELSFSMLHERYTNTRRIPYNFIVKSKNPALKGAYVERRVCLYPWSNSGWVFGHDTISGECPEDSKDQKAKIFLDEINYSFLGHDQDKGFHINKNLDLVIVKSYVVNMFPKIDYGNFVHTIDPTEPIFSGRFRLKVLILAPTDGDIELTSTNYHKFKVISATAKEVEIEAKRLKARIDLPIKFSDVPYVYTRTYAVVKLEPLEETENSLVPGIAAGTFHASSKMFRSVLHTQVDVEDAVAKESSNMVELQGFLDNLFSQVNSESNGKIIDQQLARKTNTSAEQAFMERAKTETELEDFTNISLSSLDKKLSMKLEKQERLALFEDNYSRDTMRKFCDLFFSNETVGSWVFKSYKDINYKKCIEAPETMMDVSAYSHIKALETKNPRVEFSNTIRIHSGAGTGSYHGTSDRVSTSRSIKAGLGVKFDIPVVKIGVNGGIDVGKMWGHDMQTGSSNRADVGTGVDLYAEKLILGFKAYTNKCVTLTGTNRYELELQEHHMPYGYGGGMPHIIERRYDNPKRFRICMDNIVEEQLTESWFYIGEGHQFNTILRDGLSMAENKFVTLIRGEKNFARFTDFVNENAQNIFLKKVKKTVLPDTYMKDTFSNFLLAFDRDHDLVADIAIPGTVEKYDDLGNADDQYYDELPVKDFNPLTSSFGEKNN
ncbi:hypothetical protein [Bacteriovorax sp. Seq25_V]|uniref:hypothetical protein n=1 Tax=Bacteriovorax sp. Seq25_V TaxID=1201288 RepID=UPI00038A147A|nr:hypothetical protein [Bacteriovorax sp. Seq25_V]EQC44334.1 hypothetical protein M900_A0445 [Bacteriovorax sp. Seq25_V]